MAQAEQPVAPEPQGVEIASTVVEAAKEEVSKEVQASEAEEKIAEAVEEKKMLEDTTKNKPESQETETQLVTSAVEKELSVASFKEESYHVADLKDWEKKALQDFKLKIAEAIKVNGFSAAPKAEASREVEVVKPPEDTQAGGKKTEEGEGAEVKVEEAETVIPATEETPSAVVEEAAAATPHGEDTVAVKEEASPAPLAEEVVVVSVTEESALTSEEPVVTAKEREVSDIKAVSEEVSDVKDVPTEFPTEAGGETSGEKVAAENGSREVAVEEEEATAPIEEFSIWGVPLVHSKGDERTDVVLLKFLRARDLNVNDAFKMIRETVSWRKEFEADGLVEEQFGSEFESVAYMQGYDKEGHPICYNQYGIFQDKDLYQKTMGEESNFKHFLRWRIQVLEKGIQQLSFSPGGVNSMVQVFDLKDSPGFGKWIQMTKKAFQLLQDNYPELVAKQIFINVPWYFGAVYSLYERIFTPRQKSKLVVARPGKVTETLFKYISPEHVPVKYGGFSKPNDTEFESVEAPVTEITVKPGETKILELPVGEGETTVVWDVAVVGWEVVYGEEFVPSAEGGYTVIIQKPKRMAACEDSVRNSFRVSEPGKIVLTIDNSASRRKKTILYRYTTKKTVPVTDL